MHSILEGQDFDKLIRFAYNFGSVAFDEIKTMYHDKDT